jgi:hypothetical protein
MDNLRALLAGPVHVARLAEELRSLRSDLCDAQAHPAVLRLLERLAEFECNCPICWSDAGGDFRIAGCCGYVTCATCHGRTAACAFCRTPWRTAFAPSELGTPPPLECNETLDEPAFGDDFHTDLMARTGTEKRQIDNFKQVLRVAAHHGFKRLVVLVEDNVITSSGVLSDFYNFADPHYDVVRVDTLLSASGSRFAAVKAAFDAPGTRPTALFCYGMAETFVTGTDLAAADLLVVVGSIPAKYVTQCLGRIFRPNPLRNNARPMHVVKLYVGFRPSRVRARE